jgi:hypothetical protein
MGRLIIHIHPCIHIHSRCLCLQHGRYTSSKIFRNKTTRKIRFSHNPAIGIIAGNRKVITLMSRIVPVTGYKSLHSRHPSNVVASHIRIHVYQQCKQYRRVIARRTRSPVGGGHPRQIKFLDDLHYKVRQVPLRQPFIHRRQQQKSPAEKLP